MNVAIFTDNDFDKVNGVTTAVSRGSGSAPAGIHLRVYTAASLPVETDSYLARDRSAYRFRSIRRCRSTSRDFASC